MVQDVRTTRYSRRWILKAGLATAGTCAVQPAWSATSSSATETKSGGTSTDTFGVGPAVFFRERLGLDMQPATQAAATFELEAVRQLTVLGYAKRFGRWNVVASDKPEKVIGTLIAAQFGRGAVPGTDGDDLNKVDSYDAYDLSEPTVTAFVTAKTDDEHAAILRHRHWDSLHVFAPIASKQELADMLLPVRAKQPVHSWDRGRLFERGVVEYFSALGEVNIQAERAFRRLRLKNIHGQPIYDKNNA